MVCPERAKVWHNLRSVANTDVPCAKLSHAPGQSIDRRIATDSPNNSSHVRHTDDPSNNEALEVLAIAAYSMDAALEIAKACPFLDIIGTLEASEINADAGPHNC